MSLTPMMQQYLDTKAQYPDAILFYRLGDFYEMFFDDAKLVSKELELTLTGKDCGLEERAPMCGVPFHSAESYIARLVANGHKVVICEQVENPKEAKGLVRREVVRILTPGTVTDTEMLNESKNNYLCAVYCHEDAYAVCFADVSTGDFHTTVFCDEHRADRLQNELATYVPKEILLYRGTKNTTALERFCQERLHAGIELGYGNYFLPDRVAHTIRKHFKKEPKALGLTRPGHAEVVGALLQYVEETQKCEISYVKNLDVYTDTQYMELDVNTRRNLELCETMRTKEKKGTLLWVLDHTKTAMGSRLLHTWIEMPLRSVNDIVERQRAVSELTQDYMLREELGEALRGVLDSERLMTRIAYGTANAKDLRALGNTLENVPVVKKLLLDSEYPKMTAIARQLDDLEDVTSLIMNAIVENPPFAVREGGMIQKGYHEAVDQLNEMIHNGKKFIADMEAQEREKTGIKNLKISYNRVFGYYIEISKSNLSAVPQEYIRKQTLTTGERYITQPLKELEATILGASDKIASLEYELFQQVRAKVASQAARIQQTGNILALLDVYYSLATVAQRQNYVCPEVDNSTVIDIKEGRHPVVERFVTDRYFVPNDTYLDTDINRLALITGPNMAGKSTYMRQTALIVLMAQIGSFVPAKEARIGIVDKLFTRVGASDDLASGQSTFMLEMNEVAYILKHATKQSLIIYDEIGRGTSTFDGMSIAQAVAEYTASKAIGAKTLFATHYHELTEMEQTVAGVFNLHIAAKKKEDTIIFLRKIVKGATDDSYGIEVAKLAGVPNEVIKKAKKVLENLEKEAPVVAKSNPAVEPQQQMLTFASLAQDELIEKIKKVELNLLTPLEAMNLIYTWKQEIDKL